MITKKAINHLKSRNTALFIGLIIALIVFIVLDLLFGSVKIPFNSFLSFITGNKVDDPVFEQILLNFRLPKTITAILAGSSLAVSGLQMQTIFRNPLAGPYVLGISSGASLGVALVVLGLSAFSIPIWLSHLSIVTAALLGSMLVLMLVLAVSVRVKEIMTILILGMMFGSAASAVVSVLQYFSSESMLRSFVIWTMGSLGSVTGIQIWFFALLSFLGLLLAILLARPMNVIILGENYARNLGLRVGLIRFLVFLSTSMLAGATTAFCGPIGFIGIAVPHVVKMIFKTSNHLVLIPATIIAGATLLLICDIISQLPGMDFTLPINSIAALMGIPVVIYVVIRNKRFSGM
ncbi:MAG: iron chelate uptake ABC transporter family permease subunit [Tenuifilaceae bacterium]